MIIELENLVKGIAIQSGGSRSRFLAPEALSARLRTMKRLSLCHSSRSPTSHISGKACTR